MKLFSVCMLALGPAGAASAAEAPCVDLALVLAIDGSSSIDDAEYALQTEGFAAAFRAPKVRAALEQAGVVDVATVFWGDAAAPRQVLGWTEMRGGVGAEAFATRMLEHERAAQGTTGMGHGVKAALDLLEARCALRAIVNVSGDGRETEQPEYRTDIDMPSMRARAERMGVVINGLAIATDVPDLEAYYRGSVISGPGAFVMSVRSFADFAAAIERKLAREIAPPLIASAEGIVAVN